VGAHECAGGFAAAAGVALLAADRVDTVLALGLAPDRGFALVLQKTGKTT
jgi:3-oxoacyl-[acyl-carrier-protein] synthase II